MTIDTEDLLQFSTYYNRRAVRSAKRARVDRILSELFGVDNVRSIRLAFDPFSDYALAPVPITLSNRTRKIRTQNATKRGHTSQQITANTYTPLNPATPDPWDALPTQVTTSVATDGPTSWADQPAIDGFISDTTRRTRPAVSSMGELELFIPRLHSSRRRYSGKYWDVAVDTVNPGGVYRISRTERWRQMSTIGPSGRITQQVVDSYLADERLSSAAKFADHASGLLVDARPNRRNFSLIREIGELKDLPRLIQSSFQNLIALVQRGEYSWSDIFLSKEFGYDPLFAAAIDLVNLPDIVAKRVNYLVSRIGKDTTFRSSRFGVEGLASPSGFAYNTAYGESSGASSTSGFRLWQVRLVNSVNVRFPHLEVPTLKREIGRRLYGAKFRVSDLYDLIPWTWLVDWFTGLGDYVDAICAVIEDDSLVNWGMLTYASKGFVSTTYTAKQVGSFSYRHIGGEENEYTTVTPVSHTSLVDYRYQRRVDIGNAAEVSYTWLPDKLSGFQRAILGALISQRSKKQTG